MMKPNPVRLELDPELNRLPDQVRTVHLIGICGTAMGALAGMLVDCGLDVTGSDANVYPPMSDFLAGLGIRVTQGYAPENLDYRPDLVIVGNVVTRENPESPRLKELGLNYLSFPQALGHFFLKGRKNLVVAGTHGKTTTSALAAWLLESRGMDPGFMIGGLVNNFAKNFKVGRGEWFVVEGDEYDTAFFDKVPKFVHYAPYVGILTSVEFDHADIYPDLEAVEHAFRRFVALIPEDGRLIAWGDDPRVRKLAGKAQAPVVFYGQSPGCDWRIDRIDLVGPHPGFDLVPPHGAKVTLYSPLPGLHNVLNTVAVLAALDAAGLDPQGQASGLETFEGVRRRQETRGVVRGVTVIDDFAHHPTAVARTVEAIRNAFPGQRLVAVFDPRTNTSRRRYFQQNYVSAFDQADEVMIREPEGLEKIPVEERFSARQLARDILARGIAARHFETVDRILGTLLEILAPNTVVLIMSNGGFDNLHAKLLDGLRGK